MRPELLIFDWDGTLADSVSLIVSGMQAAIVGLGLPPRRDEEIGELIGMGFNDGLRRLFPDLDPAVTRGMVERYRRQAPEAAAQAALFAGVPRMLCELREAGFRLALATGKTRAALDSALAANPELDGLFLASRCADESADKPDPAMLRQLLEVAEVDAAQALMIGDTEYDMAMAVALRMPALGVTGGVHDAARLRRAGAGDVLQQIATLPDWLERAGAESRQNS